MKKRTTARNSIARESQSHSPPALVPKLNTLPRRFSCKTVFEYQVASTIINPRKWLFPISYRPCPLATSNRAVILFRLEMGIDVSREMASCGVSSGAPGGGALEGKGVVEEMVAKYT